MNFSEDAQDIVVTKANLLFRLSNKIILSDFELNILRTWVFKHPITHLHFFKGLKRKESCVISQKNGKLHLISLNNPFPVEILDYKLKIEIFKVNLLRDKYLLIDENKNLTLYTFIQESLEMR